MLSATPALPTNRKDLQTTQSGPQTVVSRWVGSYFLEQGFWAAFLHASPDTCEALGGRSCRGKFPPPHAVATLFAHVGGCGPSFLVAWDCCSFCVACRLALRAAVGTRPYREDVLGIIRNSHTCKNDKTQTKTIAFNHMNWWASCWVGSSFLEQGFWEGLRADAGLFLV